MDNLTQTDNQAQGGTATAEIPSAASMATSTDATSVASSWKTGLRTDLRDSPLIQKFEDTPDGLNKALESHANLEKLLGHEKVPIPKDANDVEGWNRFSKALGIPDKAEGYGLADAKFPESMKGMTIDKQKFAEVAHSFKLTPAQAKGQWEVYQQIQVDAYNKHMEGLQKQMETTVNTLKGEWGDAYNTNVELGQMVINKFAEGNKEVSDYLTAALSQDPKGIKFLAKIGEQFAENKIPEFSMKRFTLAPEEAQSEIDKMTRDLNGPYMNQDGRWTEAEHKAAIDQMNALRATINRARG